MMTEHHQRIAELEARIDSLVRTQIDFQVEITALRRALAKLRAESRPTTEAKLKDSIEGHETPTSADIGSGGVVKEAEPARDEDALLREIPHVPTALPSESVPTFGMADSSGESSEGRVYGERFSRYSETAKADLERFIGENLISKIGILILIIGVGIGVKYSIDNDLISPLTRIIFGYVFGFGLTGLAVKLKRKYHNFSAALMSGGMAIMYFVTFFAYSLYSLIDQTAAFGLMVMFTVFTVAAAIAYNRQVIAHIGLVGAYAVPFLLSRDAGNFVALFSYMTIINVGILVVSLLKRWRPIIYTAFGFTWLIFYGWLFGRYEAGSDLYAALVFNWVFFAIFFAMAAFMAAKQPEESAGVNLGVSLVAGAVFYFGCLYISDAAMGTTAAWVFFTYLAAVTLGILLTAIRFFGRPTIYLAFVAAWWIFSLWYLERYIHAEHLNIAPAFAILFFGIFYATILLHRLVAAEFPFIERTGLILANAFIFFGLGYSILERNGYESFQGLFAVANGGLHLGVALLIGRLNKDADDVLHVLTVLILTFASIAIPIQFDGNVVTIIWAAEAALLFWYGRRNAIRLFEYFSYPVIVLATSSMFWDWATAYEARMGNIGDVARQPLANGDLIAALVVVAGFGLIYHVNKDRSLPAAIPTELVRPLGITVATIGLFVLYNAFRLEIVNYFAMQATGLTTPETYRAREDLQWLSMLWQLNYTLGFLTAIGAVNLRRVRSRGLAIANAVLGLFTLPIFLLAGLFAFYNLMISYLADPSLGEASWIYIGIRYISYAFLAGLLYMLYEYSRSELLDDDAEREVRRIVFEGVLSLVVLIVASHELLSLLAQFGVADGEKFGLSILWGVYSIGLLGHGIAYSRKHLRIGAIVVLAATVVKLFFYDAADLETIPKTVLFVVLGITLLIASFLYNKYRELIFGIPEEKGEQT